jgi:DNA polymerase-4
VAKIASDWNKPDGLFLVRPEEVDAFVAALPVKKLHGVGKVTAAKMHSLGVQTCADLRSWSMAKLQEHFGSFGARLHDLCRGIDVREVNPVRERKSISTEETYTPDVPDLPACLALLPELMEQLQGRIKRNNAEKFINKLFVKIKFNDFQQTTVECVGYAPNLAIYTHLMETGWLRASRPVRLLGVGVRLSDIEQVEQLSLFDERATH